MDRALSKAPFMIMGFNSMLLQIIALRSLLSVFSGNELDIGITLSFWLIYVGAGSFAGRHIKSQKSFPVSFIIAGMLALPTVIAIKLLRHYPGLTPGEIIPLFKVISLTAVILFPLCFVLGLQFPFAVREFKSRNAAGDIYGFEAAGAFAAGVLFTFLIAGKLDAMLTGLIVSLLGIITGALISGRKFLILLCILPVALCYSSFHFMPLHVPWPGARAVQTVESKYGEINVVRIKGQASVYAGGQLQFSYPDIQTEELNTHLVMALHKSPSNVLVIGGSPAILREVLKYPVKNVGFVELDPEIISISGSLLNDEDKAVLINSRVSVITDDGRHFIKKAGQSIYDLIILNIPPPSTAGLNRFYTEEFFIEAKKILKNDGLLAISLPVSFGYMGRSLQTLNGAVYKTLQTVFGHIAVTSQEYGRLFASEMPVNTAPEDLSSRFSGYNIRTRHFYSGIFSDAFSDFSVNYVKKRLHGIDTINTDLKPSAYFYNLLVWSEIQNSRTLSLLRQLEEKHIMAFSAVILIILSLIVWRKKDQAIYCSMFMTGFFCMSFMLCMMLVYQALYGYIYVKIGLLSGILMIGLWAGTKTGHYISNPLRNLIICDVASIILCFLFLTFYQYESVFYISAMLAGIITGGWFTAASRVLGEDKKGGYLYGADLTGSFAGAFLPAIILIPLFGLQRTILLTAAMKIFSIFMISGISGHRRLQVTG